MKIDAFRVGAIVLIALIVGAAAAFPILMAYTPQGSDLCDPDLFFSAEPRCRLLWNKALPLSGFYGGAALIIVLGVWSVTCWITR